MIKKEEVRELILELYPEESYRKSCMACSNDTGWGFEAVYKMGSINCSYCARKAFYELLKSRKKIKEFHHIEKYFVKKVEFEEKIKEIKGLNERLNNINSREELVKKNYDKLDEKKKDIKRFVQKVQLEVCDFNKNVVTKFENLNKTLN